MKSFVFYLASALSSPVESAARSYIVGGQPGDASQVKYLVRVVAAGQMCGGCLIAKGAVLTAAHCTTTTDPSQFNIREGRNTQAEMDQAAQLMAVSVHPHEQYSQATYNADIAVILVQEDHPLTVFLKVDSSGMATVGATAHLEGWGLTSAQGSVSSLNKLEHTVVADQDCADPATAIEGSLFCAASGTDGSTACMGDSGSPLVSGNSVVGVVSHGDQECHRSATSFTKVSTFAQWIAEKTSPSQAGQGEANNQPPGPPNEEANKPRQPTTPDQATGGSPPGGAGQVSGSDSPAPPGQPQQPSTPGLPASPAHEQPGANGLPGQTGEPDFSPPSQTNPDQLDSAPGSVSPIQQPAHADPFGQTQDPGQSFLEPEVINPRL